MRVTKEQYQRMLNRSIDRKTSKYKNVKVMCDGYKFDSKKERNYYLKLKAMEKLGLIKDLELQRTFVLQDKFKIDNKTRRKITYKADFSYISTKDNKLHVVDCKGFRTETYRLKKKLFEYKYGIELEEV